MKEVLSSLCSAVKVRLCILLSTFVYWTRSTDDLLKTLDEHQERAPGYGQYDGFIAETDLCRSGGWREYCSRFASASFLTFVVYGTVEADFGA